MNEWFDRGGFPKALTDIYEPIACLADKKGCETFLLEHKQSGEYFVVKAYTASAEELSERSILRKLNHSGIPRLVSEIEDGGTVYLVREYVEGLTLQQLCEERLYSPEEAARVVLDLCRIVCYLQKQDPLVVHRDIKPSNIVVDSDGWLHLIDFEIARQFDEDSTCIDTILAGTRPYAAPEQFGYMQTDGRADIHAMGVLLMYLITGETNVQRGQDMVQDKKIQAIIIKCTEFAPDERYQTAKQLKRALAGAVGIKRRLLPAMGAIGLALLMLAGGFLGGMHYVRSERASTLVPQTPPDTSSAAFTTAPLMPTTAATAMATATPRPTPTATVTPTATATATPRPTPTAMATAIATTDVDVAYVFESALVERAARERLGLLPEEPVMTRDMALVKQLFFCGDDTFLNEGDYYSAVNAVNQKINRKDSKALMTLKDLGAFPNLETLWIYACAFDSSLEPLRKLTKLRNLCLDGSGEVSLAPLGGLTNLESLSLWEITITDDPPASCIKNLTDLDISIEMPEGSGEFLSVVRDNMNLVSLMGDFAAYAIEQMAGKHIRELQLHEGSFTSLQQLLGIQGVENLSVTSGRNVLDLNGIEQMTRLVDLRLDDTRVDDYSPLLNAPALRQVRVQRSERPKLLAFSQPLSFEVEYLD